MNHISAAPSHLAFSGIDLANRDFVKAIRLMRGAWAKAASQKRPTLHPQPIQMQFVGLAVISTLGCYQRPEIDPTF
jgi:hypothetical protein